MNHSPAPSATATRTYKMFSRLARLLLWLVLAAWGMFAMSWAALHVWILPRADDWRPELEQWATRAVGVPVKIGAIHADASPAVGGGWGAALPLLTPQLALQDVQLLDREGRRALLLQRVHVTLSPRSVWRRGFEQLHVDSPELDVRRTAQGHIVVAGLDLSADGSDNPDLADWFFSQPEFVIRNGTLRWTDEQRGQPTLALSSLDLVLRNGLRRHQFRLDATPPDDWGQRLSLRGLLREPLLPHRRAGPTPWHDWAGELYAELPQVDLQRLRGPVDAGAWGVDIGGGRGALRLWADMEAGRVQAVTADLALQALDVRLAPELPALALDELQGRLSADWNDKGWGLASDDLRLRTRDGQVWPAGHLSLRHAFGRAGGAGSTALEADRIDLNTLTGIATHLPLGSTTHAWLARLQPAGQVHDLRASWQGERPDAAGYRAKGRIEELSLNGEDSGQTSSYGPYPLPGRPGIRGATVDFTFDQDGGQAQLKVRDGALELPGVFEDRLLPLQRLQTDVRWTVRGERVDVQLDRLSLANADAEGTAQVRWHTSDPATSSARSRLPGVLDLKAQLTRADATQVHRYLPLNLGENTRRYLRTAVQAGQVERVDFRIRGEVWDMPFHAPGAKGDFRIAAKLLGVDFDYVPAYLQAEGDRRWPALQQASGELLIDRASLRLTDLQSGLQGAPSVQLGSSSIAIEDLAHTSTLVVRAGGGGSANDLLGFIRRSPLNDMTGQALNQAEADGQAQLAFRLDLPLYAPQRTMVRGTVQFAGNDLRITPEAPLLGQASGTLNFSESGFSVPQGRARLYGGDLRFEGGMAPDATGAARIAFRGEGTASAEGLREAGLGFASQVFSRASGSADYTAQLGFRAGVPELLVQSGLQGMAFNLPQPLAKPAADTRPLRLQTRVLRTTDGPDGAVALSDRIQLDVGAADRPLLALLYERDIRAPEARVLRGSIGVGLSASESVSLPSTGVAAHVQVDRLDVQAWTQAFESITSGPSRPAQTERTHAGGDADSGYLPDRIALRAGELERNGRTYHRVVAGATRDATGVWQVNVDAEELNGHLRYLAPSDAHAGHLQARLKRLHLAAGSAQQVEQLLEQPASVPALDIEIDELTVGERRLGRVEVEAVNQDDIPRNREWRLTRLRLDTAEAHLNATGNWAIPAGGGERRTAMDFVLDVDDAGQLLTRFGREGTVRGGKGRIEGHIGWAGSPMSFSYAGLSGQIKADFARGQFLKVEPGAAKLLGVLSLQALPRRLVLDFRDVFSEGFSFDSVRGDARIERGILRSNNLQMEGVNAAVLMEGSADLAKETQDLRVVVVPEVNAGTASLLASVVNPVVGLGTFLAQLLLRQPLQSANTQQFHITGSWADPQIEKLEPPLRR